MAYLITAYAIVLGSIASYAFYLSRRRATLRSRTPGVAAAKQLNDARIEEVIAQRRIRP